MKFGKIIRHAWDITWRYKALWLFGLLASCVASRSSFGFGRSYGPAAGKNIDIDLGEQAFLTFQRWGGWALEHGLLLVALFFAFLVLGVVLRLLGLLGQGGLIYGVQQIETAPEKDLTLKNLWQGAAAVFWPLFGLFLLQAVLAWGLVLIFFGPSAAVMTVGIIKEKIPWLILGFILMVFVLMAFVAVIMVWEILYVFAQREIVIRKNNVLDSVVHSWRLLWKNLGEIVVMGLFVFLLRLVYAAVLLVPLMPMGLAFSRWLAGANTVPWTLIIVNIVIYIPLAIFVNSVYTTFESAVWTLVYREVVILPSAAADDAMPLPAPEGDAAVDAPPL